MLDAIATDLWTHHRALRFFGVETGSRMTVVRLSSGALFVHSPAPLDGDLQREVDHLGTVRAIVAPSLFHHLGVADWARAYPQARIYGCPGLTAKRPDVAWSGVLGDAPEAEWAGQIDQVHFGARSLENEVVFHHRGSQTLICADAVFNLSTHPRFFTRCVAWCMGNRRPGATFLERIMIRDRTAARRQIDRMLDWPFDRIVLSHGDIIEHDGQRVLADAYRWIRAR